MRDLVHELIPHAPQMGLYVAPEIPSDKLRNALDDYAATVTPEHVLALYDATLLGNAKDGAVFTLDRLVFQNNDLEPVHDIRYVDIVEVDERRKLLGGKRINLKVNRGRATFDLMIDFSGRPKACDYVARFLKESMLRGEFVEVDERGEDEAPGPQTDVEQTDEEQTDLVKVRAALDALHAEGLLTQADLRAMLRAIGGLPQGTGS